MTASPPPEQDADAGWLALTPHPAGPAPRGLSLDARCVAPGPGRLALAWRVTGKVETILLPPAQSTGERRDGLWRATCFELFMGRTDDLADNLANRPADRPAPRQAVYWEVNVAPSGDWAAYRFERYRKGRRDENALTVARVRAARAPRGFVLSADLEAGAPVPTGGALAVGLTAVLAHEDGGTSYWALAHAPERPDFHRADTFVYRLS